jgi:PAS domain S-box-containing protein
MASERTWLEPYLLRTVRVGVQSTIFVLISLAIYRALPGGDGVSIGVFALLWLAAAAGMLVAFLLPWRRLIGSPWGMRVLYLWALADIVLISVFVAASGDANPSVFTMYALPTIFFAASFPLPAQFAYFLLTTASYLAAVQLGDVNLSVADHFLRVTLLGLVGFMASFLSRELIEQMSAHGHRHEELQQRFSDLQRADEVFRAVSELASDYVYSMSVHEDGSMTWDWVSDAFERVTGYTPEQMVELGGWEVLIHPDHLAETSGNFARIMGGESLVLELKLLTPAGETKDVLVYVAPVWDDVQSRVVRFFGAVQDVTERKTHEGALQESNSLLRSILDSTTDGILVVDAAGRIVAHNQTFVDMWRIPPEVMAQGNDNKTIDHVLGQLKQPSLFRDKVRSLYRDPTAQSLDILEFNDGRVFERWSQPHQLHGEIIGRVWSFRDITSRRREQDKIGAAVDALQRSDTERRQLLSHLVRAKEEERSRVASGIHDDTVQVMTSVAIDLERMARHVGDIEQRDHLTRLEEAARAAIKRLRSMVFDLKPPTLADGLASALILYLEELKADSELEYELRNELQEEPEEELRVILYRIAQEALTNVRKHARADKVVVHLSRTGSGVQLRVIDDGVGFSPEAREVLPGHLGIVEMREHAQIVGGSFRIQSAATGTVVEAWVPDGPDTSQQGTLGAGAAAG